VGPLHWQVLQPGEAWVISPGQGFFTLCARDARIQANHPTLLGAITKPAIFAAGVVASIALFAVAGVAAVATVALVEGAEVAAAGVAGAAAATSGGLVAVGECEPPCASCRVLASLAALKPVL
jgi:hypothetical protein